MAEGEVKTPTETMIKPPVVNPFKPATEAAKPAPAPTATLKPGLKLPPKPGATVTLKPGLKLPPKPGSTVTLRPGLKLPPKPGATVSLKPGLKLPTQTALKPGVKLPAKPVIRKPGATVVAAPLPKPVAPVAKPVAPAVVATAPAPAAPAPAAPAPAPSPAPAAAMPKPAPTVDAAPLPKPAPAPVKPLAVDSQGVGKLPTVDMKAVDRSDAVPDMVPLPSPVEQLKSVTQKLKGITQEIPQQAILRKTGIIADGAMSEAQKEAAKHKTARISLADAMGVAPVKNENAPMKTIRIKRPIDIPNATASLAPKPRPEGAAESSEPKTQPADKSQADTKVAETTNTATASSTITQRKTLKIARPGGGAVRPSGKFGVKRPSQAPTVKAAGKTVAAGAAAPAAAPADGEVPEIADIPDIPMAPVPVAKVEENIGPTWLWTLSAIIQAAACVAMGALAWFLYQNSQTNYF